MASHGPNGAGTTGQSNPETDALLLITVVILIVGFSGWSLWSMNRDIILHGLFVAVGGISKVGQYVPFLWPDEVSRNFPSWSKSLSNAPVGRYGWAAASMMIDVVTHTLAMIAVPLVILRVFKIRKVYVVNRFVRRFNLDKLIALNASRYAAVASIAKENLLKTPIHEGPLAMARTPIDFALENHLVAVRKVTLGSKLGNLLGTNAQDTIKMQVIKGWTEKKMDWSVPERRQAMPNPIQCRLLQSESDALLRDQLGPLWEGPESMTKWQKCVFAILSTAVTQDLNKARALALKLARSWDRLDKKGRHAPRIDDRGIDKIVTEHLKHHRVNAIVKKHAFVTTVFMGMLQAAWKKGVFITPEFLWLKGVDRRLFLSLNQLGGDRPFPEGMGPWAHYEIEKLKGYAIKIPCIEAGTDALKKMLFEEEWIGSDDGLASEIAERKSQAGVNTTDEASPTEQV